MEIRLLSREELNGAVEFILEVFSKCEAVNYPEDGKRAFYNAINSAEYLDMLTAYGAYENGVLIGIIASRNEGAHVALFFVDEKHQRRGIGRKLWEHMLGETASGVITVNSSIFAKEIYEKLGFVQKEELQEDSGIKFIPMEYVRK